MSEKIMCLIRKKQVSKTKEERVRQSYLGFLLYSLNYPIDHIKVEVPIHSGRQEVIDVETNKPKRADLVVYDSPSLENIKIIVEVKKENEKSGEAQVKSYGNATNARYLVWHNGNETRVWKRAPHKGSGWKWEELPTVPIFGFEEGDILPKKDKLHEITDVKGLFKSINDFIWNNGNIKNRKDTFQQFLYVLFIKLFDEYFNTAPNFYILNSEYEEIWKTGKCKSFETRFNKAFEELKNSSDFKNIFDDADILRLDPLLFAEITYRLQWLKIRGCDTKGEAFQTFLSPYYRGENDQYLTPEPVIQMILKIITPDLKSTVLDPACGTGRFLTHTIVQCADTVKKQEFSIKEWAQSHVFGIEIDPQLVKISKAYMVLIGDGHTNIIREDSLSEDVEDYFPENSSFSIVITNPPFGRRGRRTGKTLESYDLGHEWDKNLQKTNALRKGQTQGVLMLERCYQFLRKDGLIGIVLPDGIFSNLADNYIRKWIATHFNILAIVSLPEETFRVETIGVNVKTSVLIAKKQSGATKHEIFFAFPKTIGYNLQGEFIASNEVLEVPSYFDSKKEVEGKYFRANLSNEQIIDRMDVPFYAYVPNKKETVPLEKLCDVFTGKTPTGKVAYLDKGNIKILKVRCLTNKMIDWSDKKRDYVTENWYKSKKISCDLNVGDLLLASAAHVGRYIGDEIDIVDEIPEKYSHAIASAKLIVVRARDNEINPYVLLLYLRTEEGYRQIQSLIRGQTAEIYDQDLNKLRVPKTVVELSEKSGKEIKKETIEAINHLKKGEELLLEIQEKTKLKMHKNILQDEIEDLNPKQTIEKQIKPSIKIDSPPKQQKCKLKPKSQCKKN